MGIGFSTEREERVEERLKAALAVQLSNFQEWSRQQADSREQALQNWHLQQQKLLVAEMKGQMDAMRRGYEKKINIVNMMNARR